MFTSRLPAFVVLSTLWALPVSGQTPTDARLTEANEAVRTCISLVEQGKIVDAESAGQRAEAALNAIIARQPGNADALVGLARVLSQCLLPSADFMTQGELSTRAIGLLQTAIEIAPTDWTARFILASINMRSPAFLGRAPAAAAGFDELIRMQGERTDNPRFARVFELRGMLHSQMAQPAEALAIWRRGVRLFPADSTLRALVEQAEKAAPSKPAPAPPQTLGSVSVVASPDALPAEAPTSACSVIPTPASPCRGQREHTTSMSVCGSN